MNFGHGLRLAKRIVYRTELALRRLRLTWMANFCSHHDGLNMSNVRPVVQFYQLGKSALTMIWRRLRDHQC
jgi:hypothetical protein